MVNTHILGLGFNPYFLTGELPFPSECSYIEGGQSLLNLLKKESTSFLSHKKTLKTTDNNVFSNSNLLNLSKVTCFLVTAHRNKKVLLKSTTNNIS